MPLTCAVQNPSLFLVTPQRNAFWMDLHHGRVYLAQNEALGSFPCHSFQANGMFQVGTAGGSEHTACRQPLAGVGNHTWTKQIKTGGKNQFHSQGEGKTTQGWMGITSSLSCFSRSVGCTQGALKTGKSPSLHSKVLCKGNCFEGKGS